MDPVMDDETVKTRFVFSTIKISKNKLVSKVIWVNKKRSACWKNLKNARNFGN